MGGHLITDSVFPVRRGVEVFVDCVEGFTLTSGDRMITCVQDSHFISPRQLPDCHIGRWSTDMLCSPTIYMISLMM